jgi:rare lipoprotein A
MLKSGRRVALIWSVALALASCTRPAAPVVEATPQPQALPEEPAYQQVGTASWYGPWHQGKKTASGEKFDQHKLTAAHPTLPLGTEAVVTNLENGRQVEVRINDRGPYAKDRAIDLSARAAAKLGMKEKGVASVKIEVKPDPNEHVETASATAE